MIKSFKIIFFFLKKTFATRKSIGLFFFLDEEPPEY